MTQIQSTAAEEQMMETKMENIGRVAKKPRTFVTMPGHCPTERPTICHDSIVTQYEQDIS